MVDTSGPCLVGDRIGDVTGVGEDGFGGSGSGLAAAFGVLVLSTGGAGFSKREMFSTGGEFSGDLTGDLMGGGDFTSGGDCATDPPNMAVAFLTDTTGSLSTLSFDAIFRGELGRDRRRGAT